MSRQPPRSRPPGDSRHDGPRRSFTPRGAPSVITSRPGNELVWLYGFHAVHEALTAKRRKLVLLHATEAAAERLKAEIIASGVKVQIVTPHDIDSRLGPDAVHQGVLLEARPLPDLDLGDLPSNGLLLVFDQVTDPHNFGAMLRTAAAFGVDGLVTTERHAPALTGVLAKAASGGLEHVPIASVVNLARAMEELGEMGYLRVGLDSEGSVDLSEVPLQRPLALVLGAEGKGLRRLTRENCDVVARLDMPGAIKSLNVSNACAVALAMIRQRIDAQAKGEDA